MPCILSSRCSLSTRHANTPSSLIGRSQMRIANSTVSSKRLSSLGKTLADWCTSATMDKPAQETTALQWQTSQPSQSFGGNAGSARASFAGLQNLDVAIVIWQPNQPTTNSRSWPDHGRRDRSEKQNCTP